MAYECAHRPHLVEDSATSLLLMSYTHRCSGQGCPETFLLRFQCQALSHRERSVSLVERGHPLSREGILLCPAQLPGASHVLAVSSLIGINSIVLVACS